MAGRDQQSQEIISVAMRYVKNADRTKLESYDLSALKKADFQLGGADINSGYRKAIIERISELERKNDKASQSNIRALSYLVALAIALISVIAGVLLV